MARRRQRGNEPPAVRPFDVDGVRTVAIGTVLWAIAFVVLALFRDDLDEQGMGWWLWTCLAGVGLGLLGLEYTRKRRDAIARARLREEADRPEDVDLVPEDLDLGATDDAEPPPITHAEPDDHQAESVPVRIAQPPARPEPMPAPFEQPPATPERKPAEAEAVSQPAESAQASLLDTEPLLSPSTAASRQTRRATRNVEQDDDEPLLPTASDRGAALDGRTAQGRQVRPGDTQDDDEVSNSESLYRGRRARRP